MIRSNLPHKTFNFPVGEMQVTLKDVIALDLSMTFTFEKNEDIIELLLFCDAAKRQNHRLAQITIPYIPFGRQDRCNQPGEAFSLKVFCDLINSLNFDSVVVHDPHSDVAPALLNRCTVHEQHELLDPLILNHVPEPFYLVAPDAGALKKTHKLAKHLSLVHPCLGVIESSKIRDTKTGDITGTVVHQAKLDTYTVNTNLYGADLITYVIVDDIIDGGRTFIELAKELRSLGAENIHLYATHGFFTKGKQVFDGLIDEVHVLHDYSAKESA